MKIDLGNEYITSTVTRSSDGASRPWTNSWVSPMTEDDLSYVSVYRLGLALAALVLPKRHGLLGSGMYNES